MAEVGFWEFFKAYMAILIPLFILQVALLAAALIHIMSHNNYKRGTRLIWLLVVIFVNTLGPILYFCIGRSDE